MSKTFPATTPPVEKNTENLIELVPPPDKAPTEKDVIRPFCVIY